MIAVAYIRASRWASLEAQEFAVRAWADVHRADLSRVSRDEGVAVSAARSLGAILVMPLLDRYADDAQVCVDLHWRAKKAGVKLVWATIPKHLAPDVAPCVRKRSVFDLLRSLVGETQRKVTPRETRTHIHTHGGSMPYGYRYDRETKRLVEIPDEQAVIRAMIEMRENGMSLPKIASALSERGVKPRRGKAWYPATVLSVINSYWERADADAAADLDSSQS